MKDFSALVKKQAGQIGIGTILAVNIAAGAAVYGLYSYHQEQELVAGLRHTAEVMRPEMDAQSKIKGYFDDEAKRTERAHQKNIELLGQAAELAPFLSSLPGSPTLDELKLEEVAQYNQAKARLDKSRSETGEVWAALTHPEDKDALKAGLSRDKLETYSFVKDCALRGAGEGAYCGPAAAVGVRLATTLSAARDLSEQSEAYARQSLGQGWDGWDDAQSKLTADAFAEIDKSRALAKASFDKGDIDKDDWTSMSNGFDAAKGAAATQIQQDRDQLQAQTRSGHLTGFDWYLLSRWTQSSPSYTTVHVVANPYVAGGSSYVPPAQVLTTPSARMAAAPTSPGGMANIAAPKAANPYSVESGVSHLGSKVNASFARAAGPKISMAMSQAGSAKGGIGAKVSSFSAARSVARASAMGHSGGEGGAHGSSVGHAGVSGGHGSSGG